MGASAEDGPTPLPLARRRLGWGSLALFIVLALCYLAVDVWWPWRHLAEGPGDFGAYHQAGRALLEGRSPYAAHGLIYPPLAAFLFAPLAALPFATARVVWFVILQVCLLVAAAGTWRWLGGDRNALLATAAVWGLGGTIAENLFLGQVQPLLLALIVVGWWQRRRLARTAGALLGFAAALKVLPAALLLPLIVRREGRVSIAALGAAGALVAVPLVALTAAWPPPWRPAGQGYWAGSPAPLNLSLPAVALRLAEPPSAGGELPASWRGGVDLARFRVPPSRRALSLSIAAAVLLLGGAAVVRTLRATPPGRADDYAMAATIAIVLAASPISWYHYQLLQFPGLALLAQAALRRRSPAAWLGLGGLVLGLTFPTRLGSGIARLGAPLESTPALLWLFTTATPLLSIALAVWLLREARSAATATG